MRITKFDHSCLLVESPERVGIIDPGYYSWESGTFDIDKIEKLDDILITHEHPDHFHLPFIQALIAKFPDVNIVSTQSVTDKLKAEGIKNVGTSGNEYIETFETKHESTDPLFPTPENVGFHYLGKLTHPGDSHHFDVTKEILALPLTAPWGSIIYGTNLALKLKPKIIIPIHDWHYKDEARIGMYDALEGIYKNQGITFLKPISGQPIDI